LSGFPHDRITRVMIPLASARDADEFSLPNLRQLRLGVSRSDWAYDPLEPNCSQYRC
jgi:hypothetical protein